MLVVEESGEWADNDKGVGEDVEDVDNDFVMAVEWLINICDADTCDVGDGEESDDGP